jgi:hypothetical protein
VLRRAALVVLTVAALLAWSTDAQADFSSHKIVPFTSVGGLGFGMPLVDVAQAVGPPAAPAALYANSDDLTVWWVVTGWASVTVFTGPIHATHATLPQMAASKTGLFLVTSPKFRDPHGIHVGSTLAQVKKAYPNLRVPHAKVLAYACRGSRQMSFGYSGPRGRMSAKVTEIQLARSVKFWQLVEGGSTKYHC